MEVDDVFVVMGVFVLVGYFCLYGDFLCDVVECQVIGDFECVVFGFYVFVFEGDCGELFGVQEVRVFDVVVVIGVVGVDVVGCDGDVD